MTRIWKRIRHNQGVAVSIIVMIIMMLITYGCESKVDSFIEPGKMVNRQELEVEVSIEAERLEAEIRILHEYAQLKSQDLDKQDSMRQMLFDLAAITAEGSTVNPAGVVGLMFSILGIGAVIDNRLKDKVIKNRPLPAKEV